MAHKYFPFLEQRRFCFAFDWLGFFFPVCIVGWKNFLICFYGLMYLHPAAKLWFCMSKDSKIFYSSQLHKPSFEDPFVPTCSHMDRSS